MDGVYCRPLHARGCRNAAWEAAPIIELKLEKIGVDIGIGIAVAIAIGSYSRIATATPIAIPTIFMHVSAATRHGLLLKNPLENLVKRQGRNEEIISLFNCRSKK